MNTTQSYFCANKAGLMPIETFSLLKCKQITAVTSARLLKRFQRLADSQHFCISGRGHQLSTFLHFFFFFFQLFFLCMSHSKAFPLQSKPGRNSHSSNRYVSVVFAHRTNTEKKKASELFQQCLGFPPRLHTITGPPYLPHRPEAKRGQQNPSGISTKSSNGA